MSNNHKPHLYGISERIIKKIILECLDDKALFSKLEDEIRKFIDNAGGMDNLISERLDNILKDATEEYDSFKEVEDWIHKHEELYNELVNTITGESGLIKQIEDQQKVIDEQNGKIDSLEKKVNELNGTISKLSKLLDDQGNLKDIVMANVKEESISVQKTKPKFDSVWGGMGIQILDDDI